MKTDSRTDGAALGDVWMGLWTAWADALPGAMKATPRVDASAMTDMWVGLWKTWASALLAVTKPDSRATVPSIPDVWMNAWKTWGNAVPGGSQPTPRTDATAPANMWIDLWKTWSGTWMPTGGTHDAPRVPPLVPWQAAWDYWLDACQRTVLFWDVMRKRGNMFLEHEERGKPPVLSFEYEMVLDGRSLERPVNYFLVRIVPPPGAPTDARKRPFVVVDPRAGHGPGIAGSKADSEIGVALRAGHPCYFVGFRAEPEPGQTLSDVGVAEGRFLERVAALHPEADGRPCIIGNCQAGWAVMMLSAAAPELVGPILLAGAPLSYWAGEGTQNPMRYAGGLLGGSWLASLASDLGNGRFDGVHLVANFENLNPANTLWTKAYNLYSKIDTEAQRYLDFERWWGGFYLLNEDEMRFIVNELFVGNRLATGEAVTPAGRRIDLRTIKSPIVVFASWGDNITPPQQALNWILDCYPSDRDLVARGQTIVYLLHEDIGHLGIFVSGRVAQREHAEIVEGLDVIETLPPGLWEMIIEDKQPGASHADLVPGRYLVRFERRTLDDIRALEASREDERPFAAVRRISEINEGLYRTFVAPWVRPWVTEQTAEALRQLHPNRMQYWLWSDRNPWMRGVAALAETVRQHRRPVAADNPFVAIERSASERIEQALDGYRDARDRGYERLFNAVYGSPWVQAIAGLRGAAAERAEVEAVDETHEALISERIAALRGRMGDGGLREGIVRIVLYAGGDEGAIDTRGYRMAQRISEERLTGQPLTAAERRALVREQFYMLLVDEARALATLPALLRTDAERRMALDIAYRVLGARGEMSPERRARLARVETLLGMGTTPATS